MVHSHSEVPNLSAFSRSYLSAQLQRLMHDSKFCVWNERYLWRIGSNQVLRHWLHDHEIKSILRLYHEHACGGRLVQNGQVGKYWIMDFIRHICLEIRIFVANVVIDAYARVISLLEMKCLKYGFTYMKFLIFGY